MRLQRLIGPTWVAALAPSLILGQEVVVAGNTDFDIERAWVEDGTRFEPFRVESTRSLRGALAEGIVKKESRLIVLDHREGAIALILDQMAYHHAAQGEIMGEPWMVSF